MAPRIFDPHLFRGQGALIQIKSLIFPGGKLTPDDLDNLGFGTTLNPVISTYLRWQLNPKMGVPSEPFKVWRRPAIPLTTEKKIDAQVLLLPPIGNVLQFPEPYVSVSAKVKTVQPSQVSVVALAGPLNFESVLNVQTFDLPANGSRTFRFESPYITGLYLFNTNGLDDLRGVALSSAGKVEQWQLFETVGLPVDEGEWSDLAGQGHGIKQGMVGSEVSAFEAAAERLKRGANPYGWRQTFQTGEQAPAWQLPKSESLVKEAQQQLLPMLHDTMRLPPEMQVEDLRDFKIPPPQNPSGEQLATEPGKATLAAINLLQTAVSTDPLFAVTLGFGTGFPYEDIPKVNLGDRSFFGNPDVSDWDYMVTGLWHKGLDGHSRPVEYAALIPRPRKVLRPPTPADLAVDFQAHLRPARSDLPWLTSARVSWERFPAINLTSVASFAAARHDAGLVGPAIALMDKRESGEGHVPIGNSLTPDDPEPTRISATDASLQIPNNPGNISAIYAIATQNIFGIWSHWVSDTLSTNQPPPDTVKIVSANLLPTDTGVGTVCPAQLEMDIVVDWRVRSVERIEFQGRMFQAATRHAVPPTVFPAGMQKGLAGPIEPVIVDFNGDTPSLVGGSVIALDDNGEQEVTPGFSQQGHARRYRITISDFSIDFADTPHAGLNLQARLRERIAPNRNSAWGPTVLPNTATTRVVAYASDPRSRPVPIVETVRLTSLPDASGECHASLIWPSIASAAGYAVYESTETKILESHGLSDPTPDQTLSDRLAIIKNAFDANPIRNDFLRLNRELLDRTELGVTLPRGSQVIHVYCIIPVSAGGIEGPWPNGPDASDQLFAYAAPRIAEPAPPRLEIIGTKSGASFGAQLRIQTIGDAGARPKRVDIYRTRVPDAARRLDSMGPSLVKLTGTDGPWIVEEESAGAESWIDIVRGTDQPQGSWNHVWYRAVAWSQDDAQKGVRAGRSQPSPAVPIIVPPPDPPDLGEISSSWPGGDPGNVLLEFSSSAPINETPVGHHRITVDATSRQTTQPIIASDSVLENVGGAQPSTGSGLWRGGGSASTDYNIFIRRPQLDSAVSVTVRMFDPLNRMTEKTFRIEAGSILPLPFLSDIDAFSIAVRGKFFSVTTNAPENSFGGERYQLRMTITPVKDAISDIGDFVLDPPRRSGRTPSINPTVRPLPGPMIDGGFGRDRSQFKLIRGKLIYETSISDVPLAPRQPVKPSEVFSVLRRRTGGNQEITLLAKSKIRSVLVEILTPDGRTVSKRARG